MIAMLSCERAAALSSESMERRLTLRERFALRVHLAMCKLCRRFTRQIHFLRLAGAKAQAHAREDVCLDQDAKERIRRRIRSSL